MLRNRLTWLNAHESNDAARQNKVVVALKTDDVELHEVDVSHLQPEEACEDLVWVDEGEELDPVELHNGEKVYIIKKEVITN